MENHQTETSSLQPVDDENDGEQVDQAELTEEVTSQLEQLSLQEERNVLEDESGGGGDAGAGAIGIFPEEMWFKLMDTYLDSEDIPNVIRAFPELDEPFRSKKTSWLFDMVLPHLITKQLVVEASVYSEMRLHSRELLNLRLVSKRWKNAVDKSLQNHASRHPPLPRGNAELHPSVVAIPENHFNYFHIWQCRLGASIFRGSADIDTFLQQMANHHGNPFPGKSVLLKVKTGNYWDAVARTVTLLERFGEHVLDLEIGCVAHERFVGDMEFCRSILKCLTLVPNLRSLITGKLFRTTDPETTNYFGTPESQQLFPELANLKRFEWRGNSNAQSTWVTRLVKTYGLTAGLQKLGIPLNLFGNMELGDNQDLHLTELQLFLQDNYDGDVGRIGNMVKALPNHEDIRKFGLIFIGEDLPRPVTTADINDLIGVLAEFQFESVVLQVKWLSEMQPDPEGLTSATTITSLVVENKCLLNFDFLKQLPNLKFLNVCVSDTKAHIAWNEYRGVYERVDPDSVGQRFRRYFAKIYDPTVEIPEVGSVWEDLPSLEMLSIVLEKERIVDKYMKGVQFVKEYGNKGFFGPSKLVVYWNLPPWARFDDEEGLEELNEEEGEPMVAEEEREPMVAEEEREPMVAEEEGEPMVADEEEDE